MLKRTLYIFLLLINILLAKAQCPQIYDYLGNLVSSPYFINCQGTGVYNMNFASNSNWGAYTIDWGDGTANTIATSYNANSLIPHTYTTSSTDTFIITLNIPSLSCTLKGLAVLEKPVNASIQIPIGGVTTACAPKALLFTNSSTDVSETTVFTWNFGDGTPAQSFNYSNGGQTISHTYNKGTVNCQTAVTLTARNYCTPIQTIANFNPIQIYDIDDAAITPSAFVKCWPDNSFTFSNTTNRNCVPQGNTFQRQEKWNLGDYWGLGRDSIINWRPWPPSSPLTIAYPSVGSYTVQLLDSNLCGIDAQVQTVTLVNPPVAGVISQSGPFCQDAAITFTNTSATGYLYKWNFGTGAGFVSRPFGPQSFTYNTTGTYTISVVALIAGAGNLCTDTDKVVITILPRPTANFSLTPNKGCNSITGATFTDLSLNATSWNWNFGNSNTFSGQTPPSQNYNSVGNFIATLTVTALNNCIHTFTSPITVYQIPTAAFSPTNACAGSSANFTDNSITAVGDPIISWNWNFGDATPNSTLQNPTHTYSTQNTYTLQLTVNTANCTNTISKNIVINLKPTANFTASPINGCPTLTTNFTNTSLNATSYLWNFGNTNTSSIQNPTEVFTNTTSSSYTYTINLTASTAAGCTDTYTSTVTVFSKPIALMSVNAPAGCSPIAATFTNNSLGANSYKWNFGDLASSTTTASIVTHTFVNSTLLIKTYTTQLIATNTNGCKDSSNVIITIYPIPVFNFTMVPNNGCSPLNINFPPLLGAVAYQWNFGDGSPLDFSPNPTHTFTNTSTTNKTYTVQLIASNAFSCIDTTYGYPVVFAKPKANFICTPTVGCSPLLTSFTNTSIAASSYKWKFGDNTISTLTNTNYTYNNASNNSNQTFNCTLVATSTNGCQDSLTIPILTYYKPLAAFTVDTPSCSPKRLNFTNTSLGTNNYQWNLNGTSSTNTNVTHQFINTSAANITNTVQLIATSIFNCKDSVLVPIIIHPKPEFSIIASPDSGCAELSVTFPSIANVSTYQWTFGDGNFSSDENATNVFFNNSQTIKTYTIKLIANDQYGCKDTSIKTIKVFPKPVALFQANPTIAYIPITPVKCSNLSSGAEGYIWNFSDGNTSTEMNPSNTYVNVGDYQITLIAVNKHGCKDTFDLPSKIVAVLESDINVPNAFTPNPIGGNGGTFSNNDTDNDVFHPVLKGIDKYELNIFSRWGELLFVSKDPLIGWDGYYKGKLCTQDIYVWKIIATTLDAKKINKTGDVLLLK